MAKWFAIYTKPRWEKKVNQLLTDKGVECYCPLNKVKRKWSDRTKTVEEPLFKSYVFVKVSEEERTKVRLTNGVVNFVYWNGKPAVVREKEIQTIKLFLDEHENVQVRPMDLTVQQRVLITSGTFMDRTATVLDVRKKEVKVSIDSLGYELVALIDKNKIALLDDVL
ncbi:MAG: UpxY family transcription antiterminator [Chitinophagaceae bacterium]|nr:UpxY family transcription antiterminator [Chitinophagaceae bacterium]